MNYIAERLDIRLQNVVASLLCALGVLFLFQQPLYPQAGAGSGRIEGTVTDASGSVIPGALVTVREDATNISVTVSSEEDGHFVVLYLAPGSYDVSIKKDGFAPAEIKQVLVRVGTTSSVQPQLKVGNVSISISVSTDAPLVDPTQSALSSVVEKRAIENKGERNAIKGTRKAQKRFVSD